MLWTTTAAPSNAPRTTSPGTPSWRKKGGYKHFMQKEIFEQPRAVRDTLLGRISQDTGKVFLDEMAITENSFANFSRSVSSLAGRAGTPGWPQNS